MPNPRFAFSTLFRFMKSVTADFGVEIRYYVKSLSILVRNSMAVRVLNQIYCCIVPEDMTTVKIERERVIENWELI